MSFRLAVAFVFVALACSGSAAAEGPKNVLLIGQGPDGHPPATHEFMAGLHVLAKCLEGVKGLKLTTVSADEPWTAGPGLLRKVDGVVLMLSQGARWMQTDPRRYQALSELAARGGGIVALHWAIGAHDAKYIDGQLRLLGGSRGGPQRKYKVLETDVALAAADHPILRGIKPLRVLDEFYYRLDLVDDPGFVPLLKARIDGSDETVSWAWERPDGGRSFGFVGLHFHRNWQREDYRRLAAQAVLWTNKLPIPKDGLPVKIAPEDLALEARK